MFTVNYWQLVLPAGGQTSQLTNCALTAHADHAQTHQQRKPSCTIDNNVGINTGPTSTFLTDVLLSDQLAEHWLMENVLLGYISPSSKKCWGVMKFSTDRWCCCCKRATSKYLYQINHSSHDVRTPVEEVTLGLTATRREDLRGQFLHFINF